MEIRGSFISYSRLDGPLLTHIIKFLAENDISAWYDKSELIGGQDWRREIAEAIKHSRLFISCLSTHSVDRRGFFHSEMRMALEEADRVPAGEVFILPIRLDDCAVPPALRKWHIVDCFEPGGVAALLRAINAGLRRRGPPRAGSVDQLQTQVDLYNSRAPLSSPFELHLSSNLVTIDLIDVAGKEAKHIRKSTFVAMRDGVDGYTEHMSADGSAVDFEVSPGGLESVRKEGGDLFLRRSFGCILNRGDSIVQTLRHRLIDTFVDNPEYWSIRIVIPTSQFTLRVNFPKDRPFLDFRGLHRETSHESLAATQPLVVSDSGCRSLVWTVDHPQVKDVYKLTWTW